MLIAFGEQPDGDAAAHLASCAHCQAEVRALSQLVAVGRQTDQVRDLPSPPPRVWTAIEAQTRVKAGREPQPEPPSKPIVNKAPWLKTALVGALAAVVAAIGTWVVLRPDP